MGKRAPSDQKPFHPLDTSILRDVLQHRVDSVPASQGSVERSGAVGSHAANEVPKAQPVSARPLRLDQEKRILFTREESQALDRLVTNLAVRLSAQVKLSHVMRALTALLLRAERAIDRRAGERGMLVRPPNGDHAGLQQFERAIADILADGIRDAGLGGM